VCAHICAFQICAYRRLSNWRWNARTSAFSGTRITVILNPRSLLGVRCLLDWRTNEQSTLYQSLYVLSIQLVSQLFPVLSHHKSGRSFYAMSYWLSSMTPVCPHLLSAAQRNNLALRHRILSTIIRPPILTEILNGVNYTHLFNIHRAWERTQACLEHFSPHQKSSRRACQKAYRPSNLVQTPQHFTVCLVGENSICNKPLADAYVISWTLLDSIILYGNGRIPYINALFFASGAATQSGLNT
jgi:hypothetical protein